MKDPYRVDRRNGRPDRSACQVEPPKLSDVTRRYRIFYEQGHEQAAREEWQDYQELSGSMGERVYVWGRRPPEGISPAEWLGMREAEKSEFEPAGWLIAVSCENGRRLARLKRLEGAVTFSGCVVLFPVERLRQVARVIRARRRRRLSPEQRAQLVEAGEKNRFRRRTESPQPPGSVFAAKVGPR